MRFLAPGEVATLAGAIDERYRAFVLVGAYCGLRLGEMAGLRRHRVDLLHRHVQVVEQLGRDEAGRWALQPLKTRASLRSVALPAVVVDELDEHLRHWAGTGREGFVFTAPDGEDTSIPTTSAPESGRPPSPPPASRRCASTICATRRRRWRSLPAPT